MEMNKKTVETFWGSSAIPSGVVYGKVKVELRKKKGNKKDSVQLAKEEKMKKQIRLEMGWSYE